MVSVTNLIEVDEHGLTDVERKAVDRVCINLGYDGLDNLCKSHGYGSAREIANEQNFVSVRDYFLAEGWHGRLADFRIKVGGVVQTN